MIRMTGLVGLRPIHNVPVNSKSPLREEMPLSNREISVGDDTFEDHEAPMAKAQLMNIHKQAAEIFNMIADNEELEGWVQHKLSLAADYINAVHSNMQYEKSNATSLGSGMGASAADPMGIMDEPR